MIKTVEILADQQTLVQRSLELVVTKIKTAITERGLCTIALSGGSTPKSLYELMAKQDLPWEKVHIFWGDERFVAPDHPDSNYNMTRLAWLDHITIPKTNIHPIPTVNIDSEESVNQYEQEIKDLFLVQGNEIPQLDIILLGMGDDGHTASLFPHTPALQVSDRLITVGNKDGNPRITFTVPLINQGRCIIFIVAGANKRPALAEVFASVGDSMTYPSRLIQPQGELWWLLDHNAGVELKI